MIKLYIGGSPCTHWSIAQSSEKRETTASGIGWELFLNYIIGLKKYKPDYFLYENNKSMSKDIRDSIDVEFLKYFTEQGYLVVSIQEDKHNKRVELWNPETNETAQLIRILINSSLVSAQNRERYYWTNIPNVELPEDKEIFLKDVLETGIAWQEKAYCLDANYFRGGNLTRFDSQSGHRLMVAESIRIGTIESGECSINSDSQANRVYSPEGKSLSLKASCGGAGTKTGLYAVPACVASRGRYSDTGNRSQKGNEPTMQHFEAREDGKTNALTTVQKDNMVMEPLDYVIDPHNNLFLHEATTSGNTEIFPNECFDYSFPNSKTRRGRKMQDKSNCLMTSCEMYQYLGKLPSPIYEVKDGYITIMDKTYAIKLLDGFYIIRKLTVMECMRLQTVPENYIFPVSNAQAYKMLGNGWTVDVIAHILSHIPDLQDVEVLSMYDGMSCGHIALDKLGANVITYYATEINEHAIDTTLHNYPDTVQLGDAFQVRARPFTSAFLSSFVHKQCSLFIN